MKFSVVMPAHNEEGVVGETVARSTALLRNAGIEHEILVVDDASSDGTAAEVKRLERDDGSVRYLRSPNSRGFGLAVRAGLDAYTGDAVAIMMADGSDDPTDLITYFNLLEEGYECAFGSRFVHGATVKDYPRIKGILNRLTNWGIRAIFRHGYNDTTNAFKAYRREVIDSLAPLLSHHFNLTVELPLKAVVRGFSYAIVPISWTNRRVGESKLSLQEMGSRYLFIIVYVLLEHYLSRGDYQRAGKPQRPDGTWRAGTEPLAAERGEALRRRR